MKKKAFKPLGLAGKPRQVLNVSRFGGVDYTTPKFLMQNGKAIDELNYIYKNGVLQKRNGFEELFKLQPIKYVRKAYENETQKNIVVSTENSRNFNSIWSFKTKDEKVHTIAHIGNLLYEFKDNEFIPIKTSETIIGNDSLKHDLIYEIENYKSSAFVGDYKLWVLGGNKYLVIDYIFDNPVIKVVDESDETYIPTTTISITYNDSKVHNRQALDKVNLLTQFRKNKLISGTLKEETLVEATPYYEYPLDSPLITKNRKDMSKFKMTIEERGVTNNE